MTQTFALSKKSNTFALQSKESAQMAELVDALVSNTSGFTSIPVRSRVWVPLNPRNYSITRVFLFNGIHNLFILFRY